MSDLQALVDRLEIEALQNEYTDAAMMADFDRIAALFTEDAAWRIPHADIELVTRDGIRSGIERLRANWEFFVQNTHPGAIWLEGDTAGGRAYTAEFGRFRDGSSYLNYSVFHDRYRRTPDGWKFVERRYEIRYLDDNPLPGAVPDNELNRN